MADVASVVARSRHAGRVWRATTKKNRFKSGGRCAAAAGLTYRAGFPRLCASARISTRHEGQKATGRAYFTDAPGRCSAGLRTGAGFVLPVNCGRFTTSPSTEATDYTPTAPKRTLTQKEGEGP